MMIQHLFADCIEEQMEQKIRIKEYTDIKGTPVNELTEEQIKSISEYAYWVVERNWAFDIKIFKDKIIIYL